ncbi:MAG: hypothetical protein R8K47_03330 [Mariprofundaceae bacterium]
MFETKIMEAQERVWFGELFAEIDPEFAREFAHVLESDRRELERLLDMANSQHHVMGCPA